VPMTPRERLLTTLAHRRPDRVPLHFVCGDPALRAMIDAAGLPPDVRRRFLVGDVDTVAFSARRDLAVFARYHRDTPPAATVEDFGAAALRHRDSGTNLLTYQVYYPLAGVTDPAALADYPWPDFAEPDRRTHLPAAIQAAHDAGRAVIGQMSQTLVEMAYRLVPMERLFTDLAERPAFVERLFETIAAVRREQARRFAELGVDVLRIGDDLATQRGLMISPETYRRWVKPHHAAVVAAARAVRADLPVLYHSDGNIEQLIPELIDIGVTAVNPVQPECIDPAEVKRRWGDRLTIWGAVSTQRTLAAGSEADVDAEVTERMATLAPGGGYVVNFINVAWSPLARANVLRYLRAVQEQGVY